MNLNLDLIKYKKEKTNQTLQNKFRVTEMKPLKMENGTTIDKVMKLIG